MNSSFDVIFGRLCALALCLITASPGLHAQDEEPYDPNFIELPVMSRLTGWITRVAGVQGSGQSFGVSVMPLFAQRNGLPGVMVMHYRADTLARGTYPTESLFYRATAGRFPDSIDRQRIGMTEIGSVGKLLCAGDWDADGYRDLAMNLRLHQDSSEGGWDHSIGRVVIFWGNEREEYSLSDTSRLINVTEYWGSVRTAANVDFDGDGTQDLLLAGGGGIQNGAILGTARLHMFKGRAGRRWGRGGLERTADWSIWNTPPNRRLGVVDQNKDGNPDIAFYDDNEGRIAAVSVMYGRAGNVPDSADIETVALTLANGHYSLFSDITAMAPRSFWSTPARMRRSAFTQAHPASG